MCEREKKTKNSLIQRTEDSSQRRTLRGSRQKGFTLVELIVVLVVLAIIAAMVIPAMLGFNDKGREATYRMEAQKALAATQTALSDIYNDAGNQFHPDKRKKVKKLAGAGDETAFTVWTEAALRDGFTTATTENIGSYTVKEAIYKAKDNMYLLYDGKNWKVFETYNEAAAELTANKNNVIYVWPYEGKQDFAYINGGNGSGQTIIPDDNSPNIKVVNLKLDPDNKGHVYYEREGKPGSSGKDYVSIVFWKDGNSIESYWYLDDVDLRDRFKVDEYYTYKLHLDNGYYFAGWKNEAGEIIFDATNVALSGTVKPIDGKTYIENIIFASGNEDTKTFNFTMMVGKDDNFFDELTVAKEPFSGLIGVGVKNITRVPTGDYTLAEVESLVASYGGKRTDVEQAANPVMYSWVEGDTLKWWSNASVVYLPMDCSDFFKDKTSLTSFDFTEFNTIKVTDMSSMFEGCSAITDITLGTSFNADLVTSVNSMFSGCSSLATIDLGNFTAKDGNLQDVAGMFNGCAEVVELAFSEDFDTSNISSESDGFKNMFNGCKKAETISVEGFKTSNVTDISYMFNDCESLAVLDLSGWNPANFETLDHSFCNMKSLASIDFGDKWTMSKVNTMASAFEGCLVLNVDLSKVEITGSKLKDVSATFKDCYSLTTADLSNWDVSKVMHMTEMFSMYNENDVLNMSSLTSIVMDGWNTESLKDMDYMFRGCSELTTIDFSGWDLNKVQSMEGVFQGCSALNQDFSDFVVTKHVKSIAYIFDGCSSLTSLNLDSWDTSGVKKVEDFIGVFTGCSSLKEIYATVNFVVPESCYDAVMFGNNDVLVGGHGTSWAVEQDNTAKKAWLDRREGRADVKGYFIDRNDVDSYSQLVVLEENWPNSLFGIISAKSSITGFERFTDAQTLDDITSYLEGKTAFRATDDTFAPNNDSTKTNPVYYNMNNINDETGEPMPYQVYFWAENGTIKWWSDAKYVYVNPGVTGKSQKMFYNWNNIETINLDGLDFSKVIDLSKVFWGSNKLKTINGFSDAFCNNNVATTTSQMFYNCLSLKSVDLSNFHTGTVTDMSYMFYNCKELTSLDLTSFDTGNVTRMAAMFSDCEKLKTITLNKETFNTSKVGTNDNVSNIGKGGQYCQSFEQMFFHCYALESVDVSGFDTSNARSMYKMFDQCRALTSIDVSNFDTSNVTHMGNMFYFCLSLETIDISNFTTEKVTNCAKMFCMYDKDNTSITDNELKTIIFGEDFTCENVTDMSQMFRQCKHIEYLELVNFNTDSLTNTSEMFRDCTNLVGIFVSDPDKKDGEGFYFRTASGLNRPITSSNDMFTNCGKLKGNVTSVADKKVYDATYACVDKTGQEGYFKGGRMPAQLVATDANWLNTYFGANKGNITRFERNTTLSSAEVLALYEAGTAKDLHDPSFGDVPVYFWVENNVVKWWSEAWSVYVNPGTVNMFRQWFKVQVIDCQGLDFSKVVSFDHFFFECKELTRIIDGSISATTDYAIQTNSATIMSFMFDTCDKLEVINTNGFATNNVTDMRNMFARCRAVKTIDLSGFSSEKLEKCTSMFKTCINVESIIMGKDFTCEKVDSFEQLFFECKKLKSMDFSNISTQNNKSMKSVFCTCNELESVTFGKNFTCEKVTTMQSMFWECKKLTELDLRYFNTLALTTTCARENNKDFGMFYNCTSLRTIYVTDPEGNDGYGFYSHVNGYGRTNIADNKSTYMFYGCTSLVGGNTEDPTHYDSNHINAEYARVDKDGQPGYFTAANVAKKAKIKSVDASWLQTYLGADKKSILGFTRNKAFDTEEALSSYLEGKSIEKVDMSDTSYKDDLGRSVAVYFWVEDNVVYWWSEAKIVLAATKDSGTTESTATNYGMFSGWEIVTRINLEGFDFSEVSCFTAMFADCYYLSKIYDGDVNNNYKMNTASATNMMFMFDDCRKLETVDLSGFNTDNVTNMHNMFARCGQKCTSTTSLDLSTFNTSNVTDMGSMFKECEKLTTIYVTDPNGADTPAGKGFVVSGIANGKDAQMFNKCSVLVGGQGTTWSSTKKTNKEYARVDRKNEDPSVPGYFTAK